MVRFTLTTVLYVLTLTVSSCHAFTVGPHNHNHHHNVARRTINSNVVLHMNLFDRFARVAKSNLNNIANKLEDPEKIMEQALEEMQVSQSTKRDRQRGINMLGTFVERKGKNLNSFVLIIILVSA
mmetsp:Transcript_14856/g.14763  ORF Transcript_14856/g.14763 Transcript_14856/m.14763 type:complete len:125 (+) Transcript_14856:71-445(+)